MSHHLLSASPSPPQLETLSIQSFANQGSLIGQRKAPELNNQLQTPWGSELILVFFCFSKSVKSTHFSGTHFSLLQHKSVISLVPSRDFWLHSTWENVLLSPVKHIYFWRAECGVTTHSKSRARDFVFCWLCFCFAYCFTLWKRRKWGQVLGIWYL